VAFLLPALLPVFRFVGDTFSLMAFSEVEELSAATADFLAVAFAATVFASGLPEVSLVDPAADFFAVLLAVAEFPDVLLAVLPAALLSALFAALFAALPAAWAADVLGADFCAVVRFGAAFDVDLACADFAVVFAALFFAAFLFATSWSSLP
jgi:hypothetical protein